MEKYLNQFFITMAQALQVTPQQFAKYFYGLLIFLIAVLLVVAIFKKMKVFIWVVIGIAIMLFAFGGVGTNMGAWVSSQIDAEYCQSHPETFWCKS